MLYQRFSNPNKRLTKVYRTLFVLAFIILTCAYSSAQQPAEEARTGIISGKVVNDTGEPLVGATISIRPAGIVSSGRSATSNLEGNFQVSGLDNALYYVTAISPAYVIAPLDLDSPMPTYRVGDAVRLELIRGGVITGNVTNPNGDPVLGVRVRAFMVRDANGKPTRGRVFSFSERSTDDRGIYRIYGLAPGSYLVQAGGGAIQGGLNATDFDAPTYAPSSTRDTATEIQVHAGEETTVDIRYRNEPGHTISGKVKVNGNSGASVSLNYVRDGVVPTNGSYQPPAGQGFVLAGIADGEYEITAQEVVSTTSQAYPDIAIADPIRVTVKGADITGLELIPKPLASISGKITLETSKLSDCQNKRQPLFSETMVTMLQNRKEERTDQVALLRLFVGTSTADKDGAFTIRNIRSGQYSFSPRFFARYWYFKSISLFGATSGPQTKTSSSITKDIARNWMPVKTGDRIIGLTITLSEGAASIRGQITKSGDAKPDAGLSVYLVPSERDKVEDPLRYFTAEINGDGTFLLTNLPPGRYWALAQQFQAETPTSTEKLRLPDALEARTNIRRAAEAAKVEVELKPCQGLNDFKLRPN
jgi:hypothetical protein